MHLLRLAILLIFFELGLGTARSEPRIELADIVVGDVLPLRVTGLGPEERVRIHSLRQIEIYRQSASGDWRRVPTQMHGWADLSADRKGVVDIRRDAPLAGTYTVRDDLGLLWSAYPADDPAVASAWKSPSARAAAPGDDLVALVVERQGASSLRSQFRLLGARAGTRIETIVGLGFTGVFASPPGARGLPTLIVLHGSEGGSIAKAQAAASRFASQGFASLALIYFAWDYERPEGVTHSRIETIPVEMLSSARSWLATRPEADVDRRLALVGTSKGAEFSLVGAAVYPWVRAVVGCVPSDVVWQGFDQTSSEQPAASSWSVGGRPLSFVPLYPFPEGNPEGYRTNTERYERSRREHAAEAERARIPVERSIARLLLIGSGRDEVWASGTMSATIARSLKQAGRPAQAEVLSFARAGHQVCGDGTFPVRAYQQQSSDTESKVLEAEGHAAVIAFRRTIDFLREALAIPEASRTREDLNPR